MFNTLANDRETTFVRSIELFNEVSLMVAMFKNDVNEKLASKTLVFMSSGPKSSRDSARIVEVFPTPAGPYSSR